MEKALPTAKLTPENPDFLRNFPLFSDFTPEELADIQFLARPIQVPSGQKLFDQGDPPNGMYLVEEGLVRIFARLPGDEVVELSQLGSGELIGEVSLVDHSVRTASAEVLETLTGYFFSQQHFAMLQHDLRPSAFHAMNKITLTLCGRIRGMIEEIRLTLPNKNKTDANLMGSTRGKSSSSHPREAPRELNHALLSQLPLFADFTEEEVNGFLDKVKRKDVARGQQLFTQGDPPKNCYVVVRGALLLSVSNEETSEQLLVAGPGQLAGDIAMMDGMPQAATCMARESAIVLEMPRKAFNALHDSGDAVAFKFFNGINKSLVGKLRKNVRNTARLASQGRISLGKRGGYRLPEKKTVGHGLYEPDPTH